VGDQYNRSTCIKNNGLNIMKQVILLIMLLVVSTQVISGKLYKWVDKDGRVNYTQTPPPDPAAADNAEEMDISSAVLKPRRKRGSYYCGRDELPKLSGDAAYKISSLQNKIYSWEDAIERRETQRADNIKRRYYSAQRLNETLRRHSQEDLEDRCKLVWAKEKLSLLQGDKKEIIQRSDDIKVAIEDLKSKKLRECGKDERKGWIAVDDEYREYLDCTKRYDRELRKLKRELKNAERNRSMVEPE